MMAGEQPTYVDRITQDPKVMVGKPVVRGTRIPVELVLGHLAGNPGFHELFAAYPELTVKDVKAVLAYAQPADHQRANRYSAGLATAPGSSEPGAANRRSVTRPR